MDLTEAKDIKKRWQDTKELHKKGSNDPDNHNGVVTRPETDIQECEFKWALGNITTNKPRGGDGIPAEFSKFAGILSAALSQHHLLGFEIAHLEFHYLHWLCS